MEQMLSGKLLLKLKAVVQDLIVWLYFKWVGLTLGRRIVQMCSALCRCATGRMTDWIEQLQQL